MKINPINDMTTAYREMKPVETREIEINVQKPGAPSPAQEALKTKADEKRITDDGRETIGVSNDGDIAKASREGLENVSEGIVLKKSTENVSVEKVSSDKLSAEKLPAERMPAVNAGTVKGTEESAPVLKTDETQKKSDADEAEEASKNVGSLLSYSKSELQRLYLQGEINSNQLDKELERREEVRGEKTEAYQKVIADEMEEKKTNDQIAADMEDKREYGVQQVTTRDENVVKADRAASDQRVEAEKQDRQAERTREADTKDEAEAAAENRKRIITEEMALDEDFQKEMNVLSGAERQDKITSDALDTAVEYGRLKIMEQVLGVDPATASNV